MDTVDGSISDMKSVVVIRIIRVEVKQRVGRRRRDWRRIGSAAKFAQQRIIQRSSIANLLRPNSPNTNQQGCNVN